MKTTAVTTKAVKKGSKGTYSSNRSYTVSIYTLTPNPALDLSGHVREILPNEKNHVFKARRDPGGNGINAARIANRLVDFFSTNADTRNGKRKDLNIRLAKKKSRVQVRVFAMGFLGGPTGAEYKSLLNREGLKFQFTKIVGDTRTNVTVTNDSDHKQTRLTFPGPKVSRSEIQSLRASISKLKSPGIFVLGGSLPADCDPDLYNQLTNDCVKKGLGVIADIPAAYLKKYLDHLKQPLLLIKPNQVELEEFVGCTLRTERDLISAGHKLAPKAAIVCISLGGQGAIFIANEKVWIARPPKIKAKGSVGAGDSMVGAMSTRLAYLGLTTPIDIKKATDAQLKDAFSWGIAAGAASAQTEGTGLGSAHSIQSLQKKVSII